MREDHDSSVHPGRDLPARSFTFTVGVSVTIAYSDSNAATITVSLPGTVPLTIVTTQSFALARALSEAIAERNARSEPDGPA